MSQIGENIFVSLKHIWALKTEKDATMKRKFTKAQFILSMFLP